MFDVEQTIRLPPRSMRTVSVLTHDSGTGLSTTYSVRSTLPLPAAPGRVFNMTRIIVRGIDTDEPLRSPRIM